MGVEAITLIQKSNQADAGQPLYNMNPTSPTHCRAVRLCAPPSYKD